MELRRRVGLRAPPKVMPVVRGAEYLIAHACFYCRKSWKKHSSAEISVCPQCGGPLCIMGRSFKAPKRTDIKQWEKVRILWFQGFRFWSYGSNLDAEALPDRLQDVNDFIRRNPSHPLRVRYK